jgi:hypothetical protein
LQLAHQSGNGDELKSHSDPGEKDECQQGPATSEESFHYLILLFKPIFSS